MWSEPDVRCSVVKWSVTGPKARAAFMASPWLSVGKGGLQGGEASPAGTKPIRRAWNGHSAFATAKCPWLLPHSTLGDRHKPAKARLKTAQKKNTKPRARLTWPAGSKGQHLEIDRPFC